MQQTASHNRQKKLAVINDFCGFGRCSIAVALPIISAMHIQCCPLPTAIFSDHTGFESFFCEDFTEHMPAYAGEWEKLGLHFDGIARVFSARRGRSTSSRTFSRGSKGNIRRFWSTL